MFTLLNLWSHDDPGLCQNIKYFLIYYHIYSKLGTSLSLSLSPSLPSILIHSILCVFGSDVTALTSHLPFLSLISLIVTILTLTYLLIVKTSNSLVENNE